MYNNSRKTHCRHSVNRNNSQQLMSDREKLHILHGAKESPWFAFRFFFFCGTLLSIAFLTVLAPFEEL